MGKGTSMGWEMQCQYGERCGGPKADGGGNDGATQEGWARYRRKGTRTGMVGGTGYFIYALLTNVFNI